MVTGRGKPTYKEKHISKYHFVHHIPHMDCPDIELGPPQWEAATNRLS